MFKRSVFGLFCCGALLTAAAAFAKDYNELNLNGNFRGAGPGAAIAPGWTASAGAVTRLLPARSGKAILEVSSPANAATIVVSDLHEVRGNALKIKAEIQGRGAAEIGFEAFDAYRNRVIAAERRQFPARPRFHDAKSLFQLNVPGIKFVRVTLAAVPGSVICFHDVEAEFKVVPVAPPPPPVVPAPPAPVAPPPPPPVAPAPPAPVAPPPPPPLPAATLTLVDDQFYAFRSLRPVEVAHVVLPYGGDIDFKLEEHHHRRIFWQAAGGNPAVCRVKLEHERGFGPGRPDKAEIELKGIRPGATHLEFTAGGKRFIVYVTVR